MKITLDKDYQQSLEALYLKIQKLPASEIKYYLFLLLDGIKQSDSIYNQEMLQKSFLFCESAEAFLTSTNTDTNKALLFNNLHSSLLSLIESAALNTFGSKLQKGIVISLGLCLGLLFSAVLGCAGAIRGLFIRPNIIKGALEGFVIGFGMGMIIGTRLPEKLLISDEKRKISHSLKGIADGLLAFSDTEKSSFKEQLIVQLIEIKQLFTEQNSDKLPEDIETAFNNFLTTPNNTIEICSSPIHLFSESTKGFMGHHSYIKFSLFGEKHVLELASPKTEFDAKPSQKETRKISGQQLIEMITFNKKLADSHMLGDLTYMLTKYQVGEADCLTHLDKLLTCTKQAPSNIRRINKQSDNAYAAYLIGKSFEYLSAFAHNDVLSTHQQFNNAYIQNSGFHTTPNASTYPQRPLMISSSGGGGHISAINGLIDFLYEKNTSIIMTEHTPVARSLDESYLAKQLNAGMYYLHETKYSPMIRKIVGNYTRYPVLPTKKALDAEINILEQKNSSHTTRKYIDMLLDVCVIGYESAAIPNSLVKQDDINSLNKLVQYKDDAEKINYQKIYDFYLSLLKKSAIDNKPYTELVSTQVIGFAPLCDAIIEYNEWLDKEKAYNSLPKVVLHQYMSDLPSNGALHYFTGLKQLSIPQRNQMKLYGCELSSDFLKDNLPLSNAFAGLYKIPSENNPMIRKGFKNISKSLHDKWDETVDVFHTDYEIKQKQNLQQYETCIKEKDATVEVLANKKVASIMLGSQASIDILKYVQTLVDSDYDKIFVFGGLSNHIYGPLQEIIRKSPSLKDKIVCLGNQDDTKMMPIMTRSNTVIIRGGGLSVMEQMALQHNENQIILVHHTDIASNELSSGMAWEDGNVDKLIDYLNKKGMLVQKTSPSRCFSQLEGLKNSARIDETPSKNSSYLFESMFFTQEVNPYLVQKDPHPIYCQM